MDDDDASRGIVQPEDLLPERVAVEHVVVVAFDHHQMPVALITLLAVLSER
jgi:hypothetical protein